MGHAHDATLLAAAGLIAAGPFAAVAMVRWSGWILVRPWPVAPAAVPIRYAVAALTLAAGVLHVLAIPVALGGADARPGGTSAGLAFSAVAWLQLCWPLAYLAARHTWHEPFAIAVNVAMPAVSLLALGAGIVPALLGSAALVGLIALVATGDRLERRLVDARSASLAVLATVALVAVVSIQAMVQDHVHGA